MGTTDPHRLVPATEVLTFHLDPHPHFDVSGRHIPVNIVRSSRAKNMKLKVRPSGVVELVLPNRVALKKGLVFLQSEQDWIARNIQNIELPVPFEDGAVIPILGVPHTICHSPNARRGVWQEDGTIFVSGDKSHLARRVRDWIRREAKAQLIQKTALYTAKIKEPVRRITVRDQKSRWGSCSSAGNLNFSWRLLLMPEDVMAYVVAHEVAHLRHMNHKKEFWDLVQNLCPEMEDAKKWLRKNGTSLHKYDTIK